MHRCDVRDSRRRSDEYIGYGDNTCIESRDILSRRNTLEFNKVKQDLNKWIQLILGNKVSFVFLICHNFMNGN